MRGNEKKIYIKLTDYCNFHCAHCYHNFRLDIGDPDSNKNKFNLDTSKALEFVKRYTDYYGYYVYIISFHGGEPFLSKKHIEAMRKFMDDFIEWNESTHKIKHKVYFDATSNLAPSDYRLFDEEILPTILKYFRFDDKPFIKTSWDPIPVRFNVYGDYVDWLKNIRKCKDAGVYVKVNICLTKPLLEMGVKKLIETINTFKVDEIHFEPLTETTTPDHSLIPTWEEVDEFLTKLYESRSLIHEGTEIETFTEYKLAINGAFYGCRERKCSSSVVTIEANGDIYTCPNSFQKICTYEDDIDTFRKNIMIPCSAEKIRFDKCYTCEYYKNCNGGCWQLSLDSNNDCPFYKNLFEAIKKDHETE